MSGHNFSKIKTLGHSDKINTIVFTPFCLEKMQFRTSMVERLYGRMVNFVRTT